MPSSKSGRARDAELMDADRIEDLKDPESWAQDNLIYHDPDHKDFALSSLNTLRRTRHFCDVVLQVGHADLHAHRAVLASQSRFFYELFSESEESEQKSLPFHYKLGDAFDLEAFESLVNYAYTSKLEINVDKVKAVYKTALVLKMKTPMSICAQYLIARLSVENCLGIRRFANSLYDDSLSSEADNYIRDHILKIIEGSKEFRSLPKIKIEVASTNEEDSRSFNEGHVASLVLDWLKKHIQGNYDRLEEAVENDVNLLYLHSDNTLHDCIECNDNDDSAALNNSEIIQDYKKTTNKRTMVRNEFSSNNLVTLGGQSGKSHSGSDESLNGGADSVKSNDFTLDYSPKECVEDVEKNGKNNNNGESSKMNGVKQLSDGEDNDHNPKVPLKQQKFNPKKPLKKSKYSATQEQEWKVVAVTKMTEKSLFGIFILGQCDLAGVSIKMRHAPQSNSEAPSLGAASSASASSISDTASGASVLAPLSTHSTAPTTPVGSGSPLATSMVEGLNFQGIALPEMENARCGMGAGAVGNKLIVCGGYGRGECLDTVEQFDPVTVTWKRLPDMPTQRARFDSIVIDDKVYVVGGSDGSTELHSVEVFDAETNKWEGVTELPQPRSSAGVCVLQGLLVIVGGSSDAVTSSKYCMAFDPKKGQWHQMASMNQNRNQAGVCSHNNHIYVAGGTDSWNCLSTVEVYDPKTDRWTYLPPMNTPRRGCDLSSLNDRLVVVGGSDGSRSLNSTEIFDFNTGQWTIGPPMNTSRANLRTVKIAFDAGEAVEQDSGADTPASRSLFFGTFLFAIGGFDGKNFLKNMEVLAGGGVGVGGSPEWQTYINFNKPQAAESQ